MKSIEKGPGEFVVTRCDCAFDLQVSDHALDEVALPVDAPIPANVGFARDLGWNARSDAGFVELAANSVGVVTLVGEEMFGGRLGKCHHVLERRAVSRFAGREMESERDAFGITETMNFTGEPAPRAAKSLFASPPFAPAAET